MGRGSLSWRHTRKATTEGAMDPKDRALILVELLKTSLSSFDTRRSYEWKLSLGVWTAIAAFIAIMLRGDLGAPDHTCRWEPVHPVLTCVSVVVFPTAAAAILGIQAFFLYRVRRANRADQTRAYYYERLLNGMVAPDLPYGGNGLPETRVQDVVAAVWGGKGITGGWWSVGCYLAVTAVLLIIAALTVLMVVLVQ